MPEHRNAGLGGYLKGAATRVASAFRDSAMAPAASAALVRSKAGGMAWPGYGGTGSGEEYDAQAAAGGPLGNYGQPIYMGADGTLGMDDDDDDRPDKVGDVWMNSAVAACMGWITDNFTEPVLEVVADAPDGKVTPVPDHPFLWMMEEPNPDYDADTLWSATILSFLAAGEAYWIKSRSASGRKVHCHYVPHWEMQPTWGASGRTYIDGYTHTVDNRRYPLRKEDVVHFRHGLNPRAIRHGLPQLAPVLEEIATDNAATTYTRAVLRNMGVFGVVAMPDSAVDGVPDVIPPEKGKQLSRDLAAGVGKRAGKPLVLSIRVKLQEIGASPEKMKLDVIRHVPEARICAALKIPPTVVGLSVGDRQRSYANTSIDERKAFRNCLIPLQRSFARSLTRQLLPDVRGKDREAVRWNYTRVEAMAEDQQAVAKRATTYFLGGVCSIEEAREMGGLGDAKDDHHFLTPAGYMLREGLTPDHIVASTDTHPGAAGVNNGQGRLAGPRGTGNPPPGLGQIAPPPPRAALPKPANKDGLATEGDGDELLAKALRVLDEVERRFGEDVDARIPA